MAYNDYYTGTLLTQLRAEYGIENKKNVTKKFSSFPPLFRIESVIHDGQWITVKKWAKQAKVSEEDIKDYIEKTPELIPLYSLDHKKNIITSFRLPGDKIQEWYDENHLNLTTEIVPGNFPVKLWYGKTEVEWFLDNPSIWMASVHVNFQHPEDVLDKVKRAVLGIGEVRSKGEGKFEIIGLSSELIKERLFQVLSAEDQANSFTRIKKGYMRRIVDNFPEDVMNCFYMFYIPYIKSLISKSLSTIQTFLDSTDEIDAQICEWLHKGMERFNERRPVPFPAYLSNVMQYWPYSLADDYMGKDLAMFNFKKSKALKELEENTKGRELRGEEKEKELQKLMSDIYSKEEYASLNNALKHWSGLRSAVDLDFLSQGLSNGERRSIPYYLPNYEELLDPKNTSSSRYATALLKTVLETGETEMGDVIIQGITRGKLLDPSCISDSFIENWGHFCDDLNK